jgi:hypothetical protein
MTTPPPGPYPQQPPPYGYPPAAAAARPGMVTAAAVLAFIVGGLSIIFDLIAFSVLSLVGGAYAIYIILALVAAALLIWGGVQAMSGKDGRILVIAAGAAIVVNLIGMIVYFSAGSLLGLIIPILILVFMFNPQSKAWIQSRGGQTF